MVGLGLGDGDRDWGGGVTKMYILQDCGPVCSFGMCACENWPARVILVYI